ncbi:MAG: DUF4407 domain-containing protein [Verrucomicrobiales bacterium]|nr:DUF4407 domain-containing protein [Akkermansiaceae bacterium]
MKTPSTFTQFLFWLSGSSSEALQTCPDWEQRKHAAFGATVLVPSAFAFLACSYALSTLTDSYWIIFPVALVWAFIILTIDRALLASYRAHVGAFRKMGQFSLRFVVALLMGMTIAHPMVLLLFRDTISTIVERDRQADIVTVREESETHKDTIRAQIAAIQGDVDKQRAQWNGSFQAEFLIPGQKQGDKKTGIEGLSPEQQTQLDQSIKEATAPLLPRQEALAKETGTLSEQYTKLQTDLAFWQAEFEREVNGQRSGFRGLGPRAESIQKDQLAWRREEAKRLGGLLEHLTNEKAGLLTEIREAEARATEAFQLKLADDAAVARQELARVESLREKIQQDQASQFVEQQNQIRSTIHGQIDTLLASLKAVQGELEAAGKAEQQRIDDINDEPRRDLLTQTLALHSLFENSDAKGRFALITYGILTLLFLLVDTIPLMVKFFCKAGPYDLIVDRDEMRFDSEHRAFRQYHRDLMKQVASSGSLITAMRSKPLEDAFVDGLSHTRAAREFLDNLVGLETSFHESILRHMEDETSLRSPEKRDLLEAMKKQFYDNLYRRMETFFGDAGASPARASA